MQKQRELLTIMMQCRLDNDHRFPARLWHWVQYIEGRDEPGPSTVINADDVRCPFCGSHADVAK